MKLSTLVAGMVLAVLQLSQLIEAYTSPIVIKNYKMYDANTGKYFGVRGVDYYPRPNAGELDVNNYDFFTDAYSAVWMADIKQMAAVGANAVRLYAVDPSKSHDKFMCFLRSYGMYALIEFGASCDGCAISSDVYPTCYSPTLKTRGQMIIDAFAKYDNVLGFSGGNEINHAAKQITDNAPCQKKFIRDMRAYIGSCPTIRKIPVGVVLADSAGKRGPNAMYYNCRTDPNDVYDNAEWYGLNVYQHCDETVATAGRAGGYKNVLSDFTSYKMNIPVMFTELGCLNPSFPKLSGYDAQRTWRQAGWMHTKDYRAQFTGGFVFKYSTELANSGSTSAYPFTAFGPQNYGLGYFSPEDCNHGTKPCTYNRMPNYDLLAVQYNTTDYSDEPSMSVFVADSNKVDFPWSPAGFKKLSEISWTAVEAVSTACPAAQQDYTCPGQTSSGVWTSDISSASTTTPPPSSSTSTSTTTTPPPSSSTDSSTTTTPPSMSSTASTPPTTSSTDTPTTTTTTPDSTVGASPSATTETSNTNVTTASGKSSDATPFESLPLTWLAIVVAAMTMTSFASKECSLSILNNPLTTRC